jgi:hypothetical protein
MTRQTKTRGEAKPAASPTPAADSATRGAPATPPAPKGKIGAVVALLRRPEGATLADMMAATEWQAHSVRGALSGAIKKGLGLEVVSEKSQDGRRYRIPADAQ